MLDGFVQEVKHIQQSRLNYFPNSIEECFRFNYSWYPLPIAPEGFSSQSSIATQLTSIMNKNIRYKIYGKMIMNMIKSKIVFEFISNVLFQIFFIIVSIKPKNTTANHFHIIFLLCLISYWRIFRVFCELFSFLFWWKKPGASFLSHHNKL